MSEGTIEQVLAGEADWCVVHGDSLHVLRALPERCVDLFGTDPPYSSGGAFRGDRANGTGSKYMSSDSANQEIPDFDGDVRDQRSFELWVALWSAAAWRAAKEGCHIAAFSDWRQLPALCDALQAGGWLWRGIVPWDKTEATRPRNGGFRAQCEYIAWATRGPFPETDTYLEGCFRFPPERNKVHQAVKPTALMERIVLLAPPRGLVVDPFVGSGTSVIAALRQGRRAIGVEINAGWAELARENIRAEERGLSLSAARAGQTSIFDAIGGTR